MKEEIVTYNGRPGLVIRRSPTGHVLTLKMGKNDYLTVQARDVKPYTGDSDAIALGLREAE